MHSMSSRSSDSNRALSNESKIAIARKLLSKADKEFILHYLDTEDIQRELHMRYRDVDVHIPFIDLTLNPTEMKLMYGGKSYHVTPTQYEIIAFLASVYPSKVTYAQLQRRIWGRKYTNQKFVDARWYIYTLRMLVGDLIERMVPVPNRIVLIGLRTEQNSGVIQ